PLLPRDHCLRYPAPQRRGDRQEGFPRRLTSQGRLTKSLSLLHPVRTCVPWFTNGRVTVAKVLNNDTGHAHHGQNGRKMRMLEGLMDNLTLILIAGFGIAMLVGLFITSGNAPGIQ